MESEQRQTTEKQSEGPLVSLEDLQATDIALPIDGRKADCRDFEWPYVQAAEAAKTSGQESAARAFQLMAALCSFHFRPEDPAGPYGPSDVRGNRRTATPDDFRGEQSRILESFIPDVAHAGLRARIADVVWLNDRSRTVAANAAIDAYCEVVEGLDRGLFSHRFDQHLQATFEKIDLVRRALQIASQISKKGHLHDGVTSVAFDLYQTAKQNSEWVPFERIGRLHLDHRLAEASAIGADAEALAEASDNTKFPLAVKRVWDLAADAYAKAKDEASSRRCRLKGIEQTLAMRNQVASAGAQASWVRSAIQELRHVSQTSDWREQLHRELLALQERSLDDLHPLYTPLDVTDLQTDSAAAFSDLSLADALLRFAAIMGSRPVADLKSEAISKLKDSPLHAMLSSVHQDEEGKYIAESPATDHGDGEQNEEAIKATISQDQRIWRHLLVAGYIDPARSAIGQRHTITERHFLPIAALSPFVPQTHIYTYALGFARFMQGDFVSAGHLLVPQLEHSIRHVLRSENTNSSKILPDMLQEDRPLSALLDNFLPEMETIFTADIVNEIDLVFNYRPGPALRHEFAHGKVAASACFDANVIYACWFIYRLTCLPLFRYWQENVAPAISGGC